MQADQEAPLPARSLLGEENIFGRVDPGRRSVLSGGPGLLTCVPLGVRIGRWCRVGFLAIAFFGSLIQHFRVIP